MEEDDFEVETGSRDELRGVYARESRSKDEGRLVVLRGETVKTLDLPLVYQGRI